ncbi:hypothetical protein [Tenacibaculum maritimum]|uniref:hypothetical protein n=1 Tax=Tenacibaculum maritimum TaxID=107401 RepID=UPI00046766E6|nr:hypothetical protein [Tenacibaculum maritimum]MCD9609797.1 hypothetical protein [Tenacibaculum maritimum]
MQLLGHTYCWYIWKNSKLTTNIYSINKNQFLCDLLYYLFYNFLPLEKTLGIRVSEKEELDGLDFHEHDLNAFPDSRLNDH